MNFPDRKITPVYRSDGSGTTYNFTDYLSTVSPAFKSRVGGPNTTVNWPTGVGARGSSGVAGVVTRTEGAVGYADIAYALANHIKFAAVQNKSGKWATPGLREHQGAASRRHEVQPNERALDREPAQGARSTCGRTRSARTRTCSCRCSRAKAAQLKNFVTWAVTTGQQFGPRLIFQPVPTYVVTRVKAQLKRVHS